MNNSSLMAVERETTRHVPHESHFLPARLRFQEITTVYTTSEYQRTELRTRGEPISK